MEAIGPELALVRARTTPRRATEAYARLEHFREDPAQVEAHSLSAALARQYAERLDRASIVLESRRMAAGGRRSGLWIALKGKLHFRAPQGLAPGRF